MDCKLGDKIVDPIHGVGVIEQISFGYLNGRAEQYLILRILSSGLRVMVPQSNIECVGLQPVDRSQMGRLASHRDLTPPSFSADSPSVLRLGVQVAPADRVSFFQSLEGHCVDKENDLRRMPGLHISPAFSRTFGAE